MKTKLESINIIIKPREELELEYGVVDVVKKEWGENMLVELLEILGLQRNEVDVTMATVEKNISEILYEETTFRIVKTRTCKALLQVRKSYKEKKKEGYIWKDHAYFSSGTDEECLANAKDEISRLKGKRQYKRKGPSRRSKFLNRMDDTDKSMLDSLL